MKMAVFFDAAWQGLGRPLRSDRTRKIMDYSPLHNFACYVMYVYHMAWHSRAKGGLSSLSEVG